MEIERVGFRLRISFCFQTQSKPYLWKTKQPDFLEAITKMFR